MKETKTKDLKNLSKFWLLKKKWIEAQKTGSFENVSTKELKQIHTYFEKAVEGLALFPECAASRFWLITQMNSIEGYITARQSRR